MTDHKEKYISAGDGLKLYVRDYEGSGAGLPAIVCLSGLTRNSQDFDVVAAYLNESGHRVVTMDYRGRGRSEYDKDPANYLPPTYASDIFQVLTALGVHNAIFIGTSLGGLLTMGLCAMAPGLIKAVVLNDVGPELSDKGIDSIIAYTGDGSAVDSIDGAVEKLKSFYASESGLSSRDWQTIAERTYKSENGKFVPNWDVKIAENLKVRSREQDKVDLWRFFYALAERPVLVLRGELSAVFEQHTYEKMLSELPNISGCFVPGVGHAPTMEEPAVKQEILDFVGAVSKS